MPATQGQLSLPPGRRQAPTVPRSFVLFFFGAFSFVLHIGVKPYGSVGVLEDQAFKKKV